MVRLVGKTLPLLAAAGCLHAMACAADGLSIARVSRDYSGSDRAHEIAASASQIANVARTLVIDGDEYPLYYGPLATPGSLTDQIQIKESLTLKTFMSDAHVFLASLATNLSASLTSIESYTELYNTAETKIEWPMSTDNSDETFGEQRTTIKSFALRGATPDDLADAPLSLADEQLREICGYDAQELQLKQALFVDDFRTLGQYYDPKRPDKYVPNVVGFFCATKNEGKLLPVEIRALDTELTYTPYDEPNDWALAKMALEAASVAYHQMEHMAETHAVTIPLRVEAMRTMAHDHPVRALLERHTSTDFGLERQAAIQLLNTSTGLDQIIGWGAVGATKFLWDQTQKGLSMQHGAFHADVTRRGLDRIASHKYAVYGALYQKAMSAFVRAFIDVYYATDDHIAQDLELQNWANASAAIPHIRDFPTAFDSKQQLSDVMTHLAFTSTVRHHGMNGRATWHGTSAPYSPAALWKPLPTTKGDKLNLLEYTTPTKVLPIALAVPAMFYREVPESESIFSAYTASPFGDDKALAPAIKAFTAALDEIEETITQNEAGNLWPYLVLLPSQLPYYTWI